MVQKKRNAKKHQQNVLSVFLMFDNFILEEFS